MGLCVPAGVVGEPHLDYPELLVLGTIGDVTKVAMENNVDTVILTITDALPLM